MKFQLTTQWMQDTFRKYNKKYWEGKLREPDFEICHTKTILGQFCFSRGQWKIRISDKFDRDEHGYTETLLHETCHLYIRQNGIKDTNRHHGARWYAEAHRINSLGNWNITRCTSVKDCGLTDSEGAEYRVVMYLDRNGKYFRMCINTKREKYFKDWFERSDFFRKSVFFTSHNDRVYANYPKCTKRCRGYFITEKEFNEAIALHPKANVYEKLSIRQAM